MPPHPPRRRSFPWLGLAVGVIMIVSVVLALPLLNASTAPAATVSPTTEPVATEPSPSAAVPSPTVAPSLDAITPETPAAPAVETQVWEADGAEMVFVSTGEFVMGSEDLGDDERPVHPVYLDDFWIDRHEVTNERFARFVAATGYQTEAETRGWGWVWKGSEWEEVEGADWRHPHGPDSGIEGKEAFPVVLVSWNDADAYCHWAEKRLPSEAQWEKAARGPSASSGQAPSTTDVPSASGRGRRYAWGDVFDSGRANTRESQRGDTTPVGSFSPQGDSPYGVADMTGNVWEWVADWYDSDYYRQSPPANPLGPATGTYKVLRGGAWPFDEVYARTAFRYNVRPDYTYDFVGFRCVVQQEP